MNIFLDKALLQKQQQLHNNSNTASAPNRDQPPTNREASSLFI